MNEHHPFHPGEFVAQLQFNEGWDDIQAQRLGRIIRTSLDDAMVAFIEAQPFFFLATADSRGHCDCSFKGTETGPDGAPLPAVVVDDPSHLLFPDFAGNRMFNSLGNLLENPHAGLLFIDFARSRRLRVNGAARIVDSAAQWRTHWPGAPRAIVLTVNQAYWNCSKRIPSHVGQETK